MLKLYTKQGCADCMLIKNKLDLKGIEFQSVDIATLKPNEITNIIQESGRKKMPILEKDGKFLSQQEISEL